MNTKNQLCPLPTIPVFVISMENDGKLFRSCFDQSTHFFDLGTIFDPGHPRFWAFRQDWLAKQPASKSLTSESGVAIMESFLQDNLTAERPFTFVDVNYDATRRLGLNVNDETRMPVLVQWLIQNQFPVVHLVRKNPLDCFVGGLAAESIEMAFDDIPILNVAAAVQRIQQMQADVDAFRKWLTDANRIEFCIESIMSKTGRISELVVHQLCKFLGINSKDVQANTAAVTARTDEFLISQLKSQLRPALIRAGFENLFDLPRAA